MSRIGKSLGRIGAGHKREFQLEMESFSGPVPDNPPIGLAQTRASEASTKSWKDENNIEVDNIEEWMGAVERQEVEEDR